MTSFERRQRMDERNRLRRMREVSGWRAFYLAEEHPRSERFLRRLDSLDRRIDDRLADLAEELGLRW